MCISIYWQIIYIYPTNGLCIGCNWGTYWHIIIQWMGYEWHVWDSSWHIVQQMEYESLSWRGIICFGTIPYMRCTNWTFGFAHVLFLQPMKINTETKKKDCNQKWTYQLQNHRTNLQPSKSFQICLSESRMPLNPLVNHCFQYKHAINREYNPSFSDPQNHISSSIKKYPKDMSIHIPMNEHQPRINKCLVY